MSDEDDKNSLYTKLFLIYILSTGTSTGLQYVTPTVRHSNFTQDDFNKERVLLDYQILELKNKVERLDRKVDLNHEQIQEMEKSHPPGDWKERLKKIEDYTFRNKWSK